MTPILAIDPYSTRTHPPAAPALLRRSLRFGVSALRPPRSLSASLRREAFWRKAVFLCGRTRRIGLSHLDKAKFQRGRQIVIRKSNTIFYPYRFHHFSPRHLTIKHIKKQSHRTRQGKRFTCRGFCGITCRGSGLTCRGAALTCRGRISFPPPYKQKSALKLVFLAHERVTEEPFKVLGCLFNALGNVGVVGSNQGIAKIV